MMQEIYDVPIDYTTYDQLQKATFNHAKEVLQQQAKEKGIKLAGFYLISDNPYVDIAGANKAGFKTYLV